MSVLAAVVLAASVEAVTSAAEVRACRPLTRPVTLTVVAVDRALNRRASRVTLDPPAVLASR